MTQPRIVFVVYHTSTQDSISGGTLTLYHIATKNIFVVSANGQSTSTNITGKDYNTLSYTLKDGLGLCAHLPSPLQ